TTRSAPAAGRSSTTPSPDASPNPSRRRSGGRAVVEGFLSQLDPRERDALEKLATVRRYRRGDVLFHQGDDAGAVLVLIDGHVKAAMMNDGGEGLLAFPAPGGPPG